MIESNSIVVNENLIFKFCNIKENSNIEKETIKVQMEETQNDTCIKMIDYLMF